MFVALLSTETQTDKADHPNAGFLVGELFGSGFLSCAFRSFERETYVDKVMELFAQRPHYFLALDLAVGFCDSLEKLGRVCRSVAEVEYLALMRKIASSVVTDMAESKHIFALVICFVG